MKVILKQDVKNLGSKGEAVEVREGYARNYLIPRGLAVEASEKSLRAMERERDLKRQKEARQREALESLGEELGRLVITIRAKAGEGGKLFGSITSKDIADGIKEALGTEIDRRKIELDEPIKSLGSYKAPVRLYHDILASVRVEVVGE